MTMHSKSVQADKCTATDLFVAPAACQMELQIVEHATFSLHVNCVLISTTTVAVDLLSDRELVTDSCLGAQSLFIF